MESEASRDFENGSAGSDFPGTLDGEGFGAIAGNDLLPEGELKELQLSKLATGDASVLGVRELFGVLVPVSGAKQAYGALAGSLDFEVKVTTCCAHGQILRR